MSKKQMSFIVERYGTSDNTAELNKLLNSGWSVAMISPMNGDNSTAYSLLILEREL